MDALRVGVLPHMTTSELVEEMADARANKRIISDRAAVTIAALYQAPGPSGRDLAALASGAAADAAALLRSIQASLDEGASDECAEELDMLALWVSDRSKGVE